MRLTALLISSSLALDARAGQAAQEPAFPANFSLTGPARPIPATPGVTGEVRAFRRGADGSVVRLVSLFATPAASRLSIVPVDRHGPAARLFGRVPCAGASVLTNGSFYIQTPAGSRALGLVRVGGRTLSSPSARRSGGFLVVRADGVRVLPRAARAAALAAPDAIESTPVVEQDARSGIRSDDGVRFDRVGIGSTTSGSTVVVGAFGDDQNSVSLFEFQRLATWAVAARAMVLREMIGLDGGPSAHIALPRSGQLFGYGGVAYLPNAICVTPR